MELATELKSDFESASITFHVYVIRDKKIGVFKTPMFIKDPKDDYRITLIRGCLRGEIKKEIADGAEVYYLGTYTDKECKFDLLDRPEFLVDLSDYIEQ